MKIKFPIIQIKLRNYFFWGLLSYVVTLFLILMVKMSHVGFFRHDNITYVSDWWYYLTTEGRWISYVFFNALKGLDPLFAFYLTFFFHLIILYLIFKDLFSEKIMGIILTFSCLLITPFYDLFLWPNHHFSTSLALLAVILLKNRVNIFIFFTVGGILLFGTYSISYYLLPLIWLSDISQKKSRREKINFVLDLLFYWILGFLLGYLASQCVTLYITGETFKLGQWRDPHYVHDFPSLITNVSNVFSSFLNQLMIYLRICGLWLIPFFLIINIPVSARKENFFYFVIIIIAVMVGHFLSIIHSGISVAFRSMYPLWIAGLMLIFLLWNKKTFPQFIINFFLIVILVWRIFNESYHSLAWYVTVSSKFKEDLRKNIPYQPSDVKKVYLVVSDQELFSYIQRLEKNFNLKRGEIEGLNSQMRMGLAVYTLGYPQGGKGCHDLSYKYGDCLKIFTQAQVYERWYKNINRGNFKFFLTKEKELFIRLLPTI